MALPSGGSINAAGPTVVDGTVFVNSGYGAGGIPGNLLLALRVRRDAASEQPLAGRSRWRARAGGAVQLD